MTVVLGHPGRAAMRARRTWGRRRMRGFTLIEMMMAVAVLAVLAAVALPSYQEFIRRGNRSDAKAILMESAQFMERYYTTNGSFVGAEAVLPFTVSPKGSTGTDIRYDIDFTAVPTALTYTLRAVPDNSQSGDTCGTLSISNTGATAAATAGCW